MNLDNVRISNVPGHFAPHLVFMILKNLFLPKVGPPYRDLGFWTLPLICSWLEFKVWIILLYLK